MNATVFCIHGFLGSPDDWAIALPESAWPAVKKTDWLNELSAAQDSNLDELGAAVNCCAREQLPQGQRVLVGYSMGGRIALHAILKEPALWDSAVIISAHPGLSTETDRITRLEQDLGWAQRFRTEEWESLLAAWNSQPVFGGEAAPLARNEKPGLREALARALEVGSVARQRDLRPALARLDRPVLWMAGENDPKYLAVARECSRLNSRFRFAQIPQGGHRAPWTANSAFQEILKTWIENFPAREESQMEASL